MMRQTLARQFSLMLAAMGLGIAPLALISHPWVFTFWCLAAGIAMAPALIMQAMLVAKVAPPDQATEAFTWSSTSLLAGVGLGLSLGGAMLESTRSAAVFAAAAGLSTFAGGLAMALIRRKS